MAALLGLNAMATEQGSNKAPACCGEKPAACCKGDTAPCVKDAKGIRCGDSAWLDMQTVTVEAANGDPIAQYTVAYMTDNGVDTPQDSAKAAEWYAKALPGLQKAADKGHAGACRALHHMYSEGKGVEKNADMAAKYKAMCDECCKGAKDKKCGTENHAGTTDMAS